MYNQEQQKISSFLTKNRIGQPFLVFFLPLGLLASCNSAHARIQWQRKTLPGPNSGNQQTACIVADIDNDGIDDF